MAVQPGRFIGGVSGSVGRGGGGGLSGTVGRGRGGVSGSVGRGGGGVSGGTVAAVVSAAPVVAQSAVGLAVHSSA